MSWSLGAYIFCLVAGLILSIVSGFLGALMGHVSGGHAGGVGHDVGGHAVAGHGFHVGHGLHFGHGHVPHIGGHEVAAEAAASPTDVATQMSPISPPVISTFLTMFGFFGMLGEMGLHLPTLIAAPGAALVSVVAAALMFLAIAKFLSISQGTSHMAMADLVGSEAEVITPIPPDGLGEIAYSAPTGRASCPARSEAGTMIPKHSVVVITEMAGNVALVRETIDEQLRGVPHEPNGGAETA
jgi:membrane protein implicated in regulation of membrane protease activity